MRILPVAILITNLSCSCTFYVKDMIHGNPFDRAYDKAYRNAIAGGCSPEQAHRRALLAGGGNHSETWDRRKREEEEDERWEDMFDEDDDNLELKWD